MQAARRSPRSVAVDEIQQEVGLPHVTADLALLPRPAIVTVRKRFPELERPDRVIYGCWPAVATGLGLHADHRVL
jgi:hypothetical protein